MPAGGKRKSKRSAKAAVDSTQEQDYDINGDRRVEQYGDEEILHDEVDEFHSKRDKVMLGGDEDDSDEEEDLDSKSSGKKRTQIDSVMDVDEASDIDEESDDDDDDESDGDDNNDDNEDENDDSDDDDDDDDDDDSDAELNSIDGEDDDEEEFEERISTAWGKGRDQFYDTDYVDPDFKIQADELEMAAEEEKEALRMQAKRLAEQSDDVYDLVKITENQTSKPKKIAKSQQEVMNAFDEELEEITVDGKITLATKEKIVKDLSGLSHDERLAMIAEHAPELLDLCEELEEKSTELEDLIKPVLIKHATGGLELHQSGLEYVQLRHRLLLGYMINIGYYMYLRSSEYPTSKIAIHPCIAQLVKLRGVFDELDQIHQTLEPELQSFLAADVDEEAVSDEEESVDSNGEAAEADDDFDEEEVEGVVGVNNEEMVGFNYEYEEEEDDVDDDGNEDDGALENDGSSYAEMSLKDARKQVKTDAKRARKSERKRSRVVNDFGDAALGDDDMELERVARRQQKADNRHANAAKNKADFVEKSNDTKADNANDDNNKVDAAAAAFYDAIEKQNADKKDEKKKLKKQRLEEVNAGPDDDGRFKASSENRAITWAMAKNKGLTPSRKKEVRNPRVRNKNKFTKATNRRKGQVQTMRDEKSRYGGEQFGIRSDLTKSVKLK